MGIVCLAVVQKRTEDNCIIKKYGNGLCRKINGDSVKKIPKITAIVKVFLRGTSPKFNSCQAEEGNKHGRRGSI